VSPVSLGRSRYDEISRLSNRASRLLERLAADEEYYLPKRFTRFDSAFTIAPTTGGRWRRWALLQRAASVRRHYAAYVIQSLWRVKEYKQMDEAELRAFFPLDFRDLQHAEVRLLRGLADGISRRALAEAIGISAAAPLEEEEES
jgi:hypothetical protein